jgi:hypothetical protein
MHLHRAIDPGDRSPGGCLGLDQHQWEAIDQKNQIGPSLGAAGTIAELLGDDIVVLIERICQAVEVDQSHRHMLVVLAEGHRTLAAQPGREFLVGANQAIGTDRKDDRAQLVEHLIGQFRIGGDFRVEANQRFAYPGFDQHFLALAGDVGAGDAVPTEACMAAAVGGLGLLKGVGWNALGRPGEQVVEVGFDGV